MSVAPVVEPRVAYRLTERQAAAMDAIWVDGVEQLLYGGSAGGGKSAFMRALAYHCAMVWPGCRIAIFRENFTMLRKTQVIAWFSEMHALGYDIKEHWRETAAEWTFANGSVIEFLHLDQTIGADKWLSAEWAAIFPDESTQMPSDDLATLYSRVRVPVDMQRRWSELADERESAARAAGVTDEADILRARSDWRALAVYATNPGGASHDWHKREFVDKSRVSGGQPWLSTVKVVLPNVGEVSLSIKRQFVQSFLSDNPNIDTMQYAATLAHLPKRRREQLLSGDWDYFEGKVFDMLDEQVHGIDARWVFGGRHAPPEDWPRLGGLDHGTQAPTAAEWMTRDSDGFLILGYLEYYAPGPNKQHIEAIQSLLMLDGKYDMLFEADPQMWRARQGFAGVWSVADEFMYAGEPPESAYDRQIALARGIRLHSSSAQRVAARMALERLLEPDMNLVFPDWHPMRGQSGAPRMFICRVQAPNLWREMQNLRYVDGESEETVKENDHAVDCAFRVAPVFERAVYRRSGGGAALEIRYA